MKSRLNKYLSSVVFVPAALLPAAAYCEVADKIDEVIVTVSPHGKTPEEIAGSLSALDGDALKREVAGTLGQTLQNQLGINNSSFGPAVGLPVIRGLSGNRVEVLQNSNPLGDASSTSPDHAIAMEPILADRIEILRGPATLRFGPGAMGGVVNILDNRIHQRPFDGIAGVAESRYDTNGNGRVYVGRFDAGSGEFNLHLSGVTRNSDNMEIPGNASLDPDDTTRGFVANTDSDASSWSAGVSRVTENFAFGLGISKVDNEYGIPPGSHNHSDVHSQEEVALEDEDHSLFTRIDMNQTDYSGKFIAKQLPGFLDQLDIDLSFSDYEHTELEKEEFLTLPGTRYETDYSHLRMELTHGGDATWLGSFGFQYGHIDFVADGEEAFVPPNQIESAGIFITEERQWLGGTLNLGLRFDNNRSERDGHPPIDHTLFNAAASFLYPISDSHQIGLILSHSQRAPSAEELFAEGEHVATASYLIGDTGLDQESANGVELTWRYMGSIDAKVSVYHRMFDDFIYESNSGDRLSHDLLREGASGSAACSAAHADFENGLKEFDGSLPCYVYRQQDARFTGAEAEMTASLTDNLELRLWGDTVNARLNDGKDVPRIPPARLGVGLSWNIRHFDLGAHLTHAFEQNKPGPNEIPTADYTRLDAHLSRNIGNWTLFLQGNNLSDKDIRNATSYLRDIAPEPGRSIVFGLRYKLD